MGVVLDAYRIAHFLEDGVVDDASTLIARGECVIQHDSLIAIGIDDVVLDHTVEEGETAERKAFALDADRVGVDLVRQNMSVLLGTNTEVGVVVDSVSQRPDYHCR